ncbi:hypothetical protein BASA81_001649 [Batrachochytrium salamandrivorans]|nr:hypothetical protein BASA81_001649 [Batrachochytrium salamandrivorans]
MRGRVESSSFSKRNLLDSGGEFGDYDLKTSPSTAAFVQQELEDRYVVQNLVPKLQQNFTTPQETPTSVASTVLTSSTEAIFEGMQVIAEDDFWKCFEKTPVVPWNFNPPLFVLWVFGVLVRYFVLFPVRVVILALGWFVFGGLMILATALGPVLPTKPKDRFLRLMISCMSSCFVLTWSGVVRYHGHIPVPKHQHSNFVFVANHSSLIDVILLQQCKCFSLVGQTHKGLVSFLQQVVLKCLQCIWFDRGEMKDRSAVSKKLQEHAKDPKRNPLLVFPEGTCVNNEHVIQFKKGVFELGVPIAPVAIKYNKMFVDPFWSSRDQSFAGHLFELMTSWCMICDVYFLEPTMRRDGESGEDFANRVRDLIADKAKIRAVDWDGYLKHFQPNERLINKRKELYAKQFQKLLKDFKHKRLQGWKVLEDLEEEGEEGDSHGAGGEGEDDEFAEDEPGSFPKSRLGRKGSISSSSSSNNNAQKFGPAVLGSTVYSRMPFRANSSPHPRTANLSPVPPPPTTTPATAVAEEEEAPPSF